MKAGALVWRRFCPHTSPVTLNDTVDNRQSDAGPFELIGAVESLKGTKQLFGLLQVEARAVVPHAIHGFIDLTPAEDLDDRLLLASCELEGVGEQIGEGLLQQGGVTDAVW